MSRSDNAEIKPSAGSIPRRAPTRSEAVRYTYDMLISLRKLAALREEERLLRLIEAAAEEARVLSGG